jgi:Ran GTPase-activating protein (RanGAP) involved in mRNA processing and transport
MRGCLMDDQCAEAIAEGLSRNATLKVLDLSNNRIGPEPMKRWQEIIGKCSLRELDLSGNPLYDAGATCIFKGLQEGTYISEKMVRQDPSLAPANRRLTPRLKYLSMRNVEMSDVTAPVITELLQGNLRVVKMGIEGNTINYKYLEEIASAVKRNKDRKKEKCLPKYMKELEKVIKSTQASHGLRTADPEKVKQQLYL